MIQITFLQLNICSVQDWGLHGKVNSYWYFYGFDTMLSICGYSRINSTKFPTSGTDIDSRPKLLSQAGTVRKVIGTYISVFLQLDQWRCQHSSAYIVKAITWLRKMCCTFCETQTEGCHAKWQGLCRCNPAIPPQNNRKYLFCSLTLLKNKTNPMQHISTLPFSCAQKTYMLNRITKNASGYSVCSTPNQADL
jgi:hypothetical protein